MNRMSRRVAGLRPGRAAPRRVSPAAAGRRAWLATSVCWLAGLGALGGAPAAAATIPSRPVRLVVPFAPAQGSDVLARALSGPLSAAWSQPVLVDNRPGANGALAVQEVVRAAPDGHSVLLSSNSPIVINPSLYRRLSYQPERDLWPAIEARLEPRDARRQVEKNLAEIRRASAEINAALELSPGDPLLEELLLNAYQDELAVLASVNQLAGSNGAGPIDATRMQL